MKQEIIELIDDHNGRPADETVSFALDGVEYTIDLTSKNAARLRKDLAAYIEAGRRVRRTSRSTARRRNGAHNGQVHGKVAATGASKVTATSEAIRAWAKSQDIPLGARGRIPADVQQRYRDATRRRGVV